MGNISSIMGGAFTPPADKVVAQLEIQIADDMRRNGITPPDHINMDGQIHRFNAGTKGKGGAGEKTGWYVMYANGVPAGVYGDWRSGVEINFRADIGRQLTPAESMAHVRRMSEAKALRDAEVAKKREAAANTVEQIWVDGTHASQEHSYLMRKGIKPHGSRVTGDGRLMIPLFDSEGNISSLQYIGADGDKKYHAGGATGERYWSLGDETSTLYIAEGFATAATIFEATNQQTIIAYSASNLVPVTRIMREKFGNTKDIVIVADNDESGVGLKYADQASAKYGARVIMPPEKGDANDYVQAGGDLLALLEPKQDNWLIKADDFSNQPSPISWLVKGWLQEQALIMVHGPSGGGKTFVVLDWCLRIASNIDTWFGTKVKNGAVVYLAGEGHHGLRGRVALWKQHNKVSSLNMWLSREGCDLNTAEGYQRVVSNLRVLDNPPKIIVVDTLHRFLSGDENSSQDTKTMLDACSALINEFKCSVLLVHHTGVNEEAQHRARGSSAWRGALDIEISIIPAKNDKPIEIVQRKSKDAECNESLFCELVTMEIDNWFDEDGEPVKSAVVEQADGVESVKKESKLTQYVKLLSDGWFACGAEVRNNYCYWSRSALYEYLINAKGHSERTAKNHLTPSRDKSFIAELLLGEIVTPYEHGYLLKDEVLNSNLMMRKGG